MSAGQSTQQSTMARLRVRTYKARACLLQRNHSGTATRAKSSLAVPARTRFRDSGIYRRSGRRASSSVFNRDWLYCDAGWEWTVFACKLECPDTKVWLMMYDSVIYGLCSTEYVLVTWTELVVRHA